VYRSDRPDRLGAFQRLDLGLLVHAQHDRVLGRVQVQPDHVADLGRKLRVGGELERLGLPGLEVVLSPDPGDGAVADPQLSSEQPAGPMRDAEALGRWGKRGGQDLSAAVPANRLGAARAGPIGQPIQALAGVPLAPGDHGRPRDAQLLGDGGVADPLGGQQQLGTLRQAGRNRAGLCPAAQHPQILGRDRQRGGGKVGHRPFSTHSAWNRQII
jgi:hypothetical protein